MTLFGRALSKLRLIPSPRAFPPLVAPVRKAADSAASRQDSRSKKKFAVYRWNPEVPGEKPRIETFEGVNCVWLCCLWLLRCVWLLRWVWLRCVWLCYAASGCVACWCCAASGCVASCCVACGCCVKCDCTYLDVCQ